MSTIKSSNEHLTLNADGSSKDIKFQANGVEKASISSTGVMTATSFSGSGAALTGVGVAGITSSADATTITIDSRENVGIGVVPESDWYNGGVNSHYHMLQIGTGASVGGYSDNSTYLGSNWKDDAANKYLNTDEASLYKQQNGIHSFKVASSGTADSAITWTNAMTIDNNGYVTMPNQPSISLGGSVGGYTSVSDGSVIPFNNIQHQTGGSNYNTSTYRYTVPVAGWYQASFGALSQSEIAQEWAVRKNGAVVARTFNSSDRGWALTFNVYCSASDYLDMISHVTNSNNIYMSSGVNTYSWVNYRLLG